MTSRLEVSTLKHIVSTRTSYKLHPVDTAQEAVFYGQFKAAIPTATGRSGISTQLIFLVRFKY